jgi:hypothetical protein|tara:strand:- start:385 stop:777 length:393 start_codon:yes stop_codon:yes gene_type:complete
MTVKPETRFGNEIRKNINAFWQPFTITATAGVPDLYGIKNGVSIWLELKCINKNLINISPLQISWNNKHFQENGNNYYIVQDTRSKVIKLYNGNKGRELKEQGFKCPCSMELDPIMKIGQWRDLESYIFS